MPTSPLYMKIAQELATAIASGTYPIGSNLPTEAALCEQHDISRFTAREALRCLVDRGMIRRQARIGSRVISMTPHPGYQPVAANPEDFVDLATGTLVVEGEDSIVTANECLAQRLACEEGAEFYLHQGLRVHRNGSVQPLCWSEQYMPSHISARARKRMVDGAFTAEMAAERRVEQIVCADLLNEKQALALQAEPGSAALVVVRRHYMPDGQLLAAGVQTHPADRYQLDIPVAGTISENTEV